MIKIIEWLLCWANFIVAGINLGLYVELDSPVRYVSLVCFACSCSIGVWVMKD